MVLFGGRLGTYKYLDMHMAIGSALTHVRQPARAVLHRRQGPRGLGDGGGLTMSTLLQRVLLPRSGDPMSVRALYMDERTGLALATVPAAPGAIVHNPVHLEGAAVTGRRLRVTSRTSASLPEQSEVSFGAYFNAFAAGYWRHWTPLTEVHLKLRLEGSGRVDIYRSKSEGARIHERGVVLGTRVVPISTAFALPTTATPTTSPTRWRGPIFSILLPESV